MPNANRSWMFDRLCRLLYPNDSEQKRFTQDLPILAEVWFAFAQVSSNDRVDLLLNPDFKVSPGVLAAQLRATGISTKDHELAYNESHVVARFTIQELITIVLPLSRWWQHLQTSLGSGDIIASTLSGGREPRSPISPRERQSAANSELSYLANLLREVLVGFKTGKKRTNRLDAVNRSIVEWFGAAKQEPHLPLLFQVSVNRRASTSVFKSRETVKADAVFRVFGVRCDQITWAIIDNGIDARHPAFRKTLSNGSTGSRVARTFDFTRLRTLLNAEDQPVTGEFSHLLPGNYNKIQTHLRDRLQNGLQIDWDMIAPCLEIPHPFDKNQPPLNGGLPLLDPGVQYVVPMNDHGTHVAGILGADWPVTDAALSNLDPISIADRLSLTDVLSSGGLRGVCPDIALYDLRVFGPDGSGDEFAILAALQFVRYLNASKSKRVIHGVNVSLSLEHKVRSYACGRTPVCDECERLVSNGVVVVVAAGNSGYDDATTLGLFGTYRQSSITDPGNADSVITVGATHRDMPHTYGVSYFSSRGPTGDGRAKPDIVAPGERIFSTAVGSGAKTMDGTSMAAPHVSGAAALLMARNTELVGNPNRIKDILCKTATDLGRVLSYQGAGLLDTLRALESL